jgi:hypothetical protein
LGKRNIITALLILIATAALAWTALPHIWVRDRSAQLVYNSKMSQNVLLFHGSNGRHLIYIDEPLQYGSVYLWDTRNGTDHSMQVCDRRSYISIRVMAFEKPSQPVCHTMSAIVRVTERSLEFASSDKSPIRVSWMGFTEPPR